MAVPTRGALLLRQPLDASSLVLASERAATEITLATDPRRCLGQVTEAVSRDASSFTMGVLLADDVGELRVAAASSRSLPALVCVDVACGQGPAEAAFRSGTPASCPDLARSERTEFAAIAGAAGFASAYGLPLPADGVALGALLLLADHPHSVGGEELRALRSLTDAIATAIDRAAAHRPRALERASTELSGKVLDPS